VTQEQTFLLFCCFAFAARVLRLLERWKAPLLRGEGWLFSIEVAPDFFYGPGAAILRAYRLRLFLPWMVELPVLAALLYFNQRPYAGAVIVLITLLTRVNYYWARLSAERAARPFEINPAVEEPSAVALSLHPRTLREYTTPWIEAVLGVSVVAAFVLLAYRYHSAQDLSLISAASLSAALYVYLQIGLLLVKLGVVHARYAAPSIVTAQHLAWRESLRRFSAACCDYSRLALAAFPLVAAFLSAHASSQESRLATSLAVLFMAAVALCLEWRRRIQYLRIARRTKPAKLLIKPDLPQDAAVICFRPSLPALLLNAPNGYSLNLASDSAKAAALYTAGLALLWIALARFSS
jgi:hypothetical protein